MTWQILKHSELKSSEHILLGRLCTRGLKSIPNFIINFLCVSLHVLIVLSDFRISKTSSKCPDSYLELAYCTKYISENFLFQYFPSYFPLLCIVLLRVSTWRNLTTETASPPSSISFNLFPLQLHCTDLWDHWLQHLQIRVMETIYKSIKGDKRNNDKIICMSRTLSIALSFLKACAVLCQWSTIHSNRKKWKA